MTKQDAIRIIQEILVYTGLKPKQLSDSLGKDRPQWLYDVMNPEKTTKLSQRMADKLCEVYPEFSKTYLLTGEGTLLRDSSSSAPVLPPFCPHSAPVLTPATNAHEGIPLIPFSAMAGILTGEQTVMEYECERYVVPAFSGADFLMQVSGTSMQPTYFSGDVIACRRVPMRDLFFQWGKVYVLDTDQGALVKRVFPAETEDKLKIVSDNSEAYPPFTIPVAAIHAMALVVGSIRVE